MTGSSDNKLINQIDALLPQTQCEQCGFHGCRAYATAIVNGAADFNRCPPGGQEGIDKLAKLLGKESKPLDPECGEEKPRQLAHIIEDDCIGCTKCIQACPVDAIIGAGKQMHTIIDDQCIGCELCVPACPVDCIILEPMPLELMDQAHTDAARENFHKREARQAREKAEREAQLAKRKAALHQKQARQDQASQKTASKSKPLSHNDVQDAIARARAKRQQRQKLSS